MVARCIERSALLSCCNIIVTNSLRWKSTVPSIPCIFRQSQDYMRTFILFCAPWITPSFLQSDQTSRTWTFLVFGRRFVGLCKRNQSLRSSRAERRKLSWIHEKKKYEDAKDDCKQRTLIGTVFPFPLAIWSTADGCIFMSCNYFLSPTALSVSVCARVAPILFPKLFQPLYEVN